MIMNKEKHQEVDYIKGERNFKMSVNDPRFKKATSLDDDFYEVERGKSQIDLNLPIQLGYFILQYAKLHMLQFYYDCIDRYIDRSDFEYIEMDTDSAYFAISGNSLEDVIKTPELKTEFQNNLNLCHLDRIEASTEYWFPRECCTKHKMYDKRESGLFKLEAEGDEMIALCSKTYVLKQGETFKLTCKGINKNTVPEPLPIFYRVLDEKDTFSAPYPNTGFRQRDNTMFTYTQSRNGFGYFYCKREVSADGIHTKPLNMELTPWEDYNTLPFYGNKVLSNSYQHPIYKGSKWFHCNDQAFAYEKAIHHNQADLAQNVLDSENGFQSIQLVKHIILDTTWYDKRVDVMTDILKRKFESCEKFRIALQNTGNQILVFADKYIKFWGCGLDHTMVKLTDPAKFPGQNQLGVLLMELRNNVVT